MNQKLSKLEENMTDVMTRVNYVPRSTSQPVSVRSSVAEEPLTGRAPPPLRRERLAVTAVGEIIGGEVEESRQSLPKVTASEEPRKPKRRDKSRTKSAGTTPRTSPTDSNSPTDSMVRGMLEDQILEQASSSPRTSQAAPPTKSRWREYL